MPLTNAQIQTLKTALQADAVAGPLISAGRTFDVWQFANTAYASTFYVYRTDAQVQDIYNQVAWANFTPADAPDNTALWTNRALACQGKQFNLQTMLTGRMTIDATKNNIRAGLQDALTNLPSGAAGATQAAGWVGVRDNCLARQATFFEKVFATTTAQQDGSTQAKAATMQIEGPVSQDDINRVINGG